MSTPTTTTMTTTTTTKTTTTSSSTTTTTTEERQRLQHRYERLLRERAAAALMGEAAAAAAAAEAQQARHGVGANRSWSYQPSNQWTHIGASGAAVPDPSYVYGPQAAVTSAAYVPSGRASAAYSQAAGPSSTYSQVPKHFTTYGPVAGLSTVHPHPARSTATYPHVAGQSSTYNPAETEAAQLPQMGDHRMQASSFETYGDVYSEQSTTSTQHHMYYTPQMVSTASHCCPLDNAGSSQGPAPLAVYPPMMIPSSEGAIPWTGYAPFTMASSEWAVPRTGYTPMMMPSSEWAVPHTGYSQVVTYNEWAAPWAGYVPVVSFGASPSQAQMVPRYGYSVPPPATGYQQTWPAVSVYQQTYVAQGHQSGPSRNRPTKRPVPFTDRRTPFQQPRNLRPAPEFGSLIESGPSTGQAPSQGPLKATVEGPTSAMKSGHVKFGEGGRESVPVGRIAPVEKKSDDQVSGTSIEKVPGEKMVVKQDAADGQDKAELKSKAETNPETNADRVVDIDREGGAPVADNKAGEGVRQSNERGPDDGGYADESSSSDEESGQKAEVPTWQQQLRVPPRAPWEADFGVGLPAAPRPTSYQDYVSLVTPGPRCVCYCCSAGGSGPSATRGSAPVSATPGATGIATATSTGSTRAGRTGPTSAEASEVPRRFVITFRTPSAQGRSSDSSVQVEMVSESEYESYSADDGEEVKKESEEIEEEAGEEGNEEEEEGEEEEDDDDEEEDEEDEEEVSGEDEGDRNEDQQESANEAMQMRKNTHDIPQQETSQCTSASPEAREEHEEAEKSGEEAER